MHVFPFITESKAINKSLISQLSDKKLISIIIFHTLVITKTIKIQNL